MSKTSFASRGDIFVKKTDNKDMPAKPLRKFHFGNFFKTTGIITAAALIFFGINFSNVTVSKMQQQVFDPASSVPHRTLSSMMPDATYPAFENDREGRNRNRRWEDPTPTPAYTTPIYNTPIVATPPPVPVITIAPIAPITTIAPLAPITPVQTPIGGGSSNFAGAASQINQLQTQIVQQMQACTQISQQAQAQIAAVNQQIQQLDASMNTIQNQIYAAQDPNARFQLQSQRDQLNAQRIQLGNQNTQIRNQASSAKSACQNNVGTLQSQKRDIESQLQNSYSNALNAIVL